jgi:hypothetical protein
MKQFQFCMSGCRDRSHALESVSRSRAVKIIDTFPAPEVLSYSLAARNPFNTLSNMVLNGCN